MEPKASRRNFLKSSIVGATAAGAAMAGMGRSEAGESSKPQVDKRVLGRTGAKVSLLGLGLGSAFTRSHSRNDSDAIGRILETALEHGINYWDTARQYDPSEEMIGPWVAKHREKIFLVSKSQQRGYDEFKRDLERSLKNLQTDHLDLYHLHSFTPDGDKDLDAIERGAIRAAREAKEQGIIKNFGITGHSGAPILMDAIKRFEPDCIMTIFPCTRPDNGQYEEELLPLALEHKMGVIAMKTVRRARDADLRGTDLIRYALSLPGISVANVGLDTIAHLNENTEMVTEFKPLSPQDRVALHKRVTPLLAGIPAPWDRPGYQDGVLA